MNIKLDITSDLFAGISHDEICWMSHRDYVEKVPQGFKTIAFTEHTPVAAMCDDSRKLYGVQFHPEVEHTPFGQKMIQNFLI